MSRTVFVTHSSAPAGAELSLLRTVATWSGAEQPIVVLGQSDGLTSAFEATDATICALPMSDDVQAQRRGQALTSPVRTLWSLLSYARELRTLLKSLEPDVVVARSLKAVLYARLATWGTGVTFVWSVHDRLTRDYLGWLAWVYANCVSRVCDAFIVNSESTLSTVATHGRHVLILPPSVSEQRTPRVEKGRRPQLAIVGRLAPWKGQDQAIEAFAAELGGTEAELSIIGGALFGETDFELSLHDLTRRLGLEQQVTFVGHVDDPRVHLASVDILLHASTLPEPFGAVVLEGMEAGCIVVATSPGGPAEVIQHGRNGLLADAGDVVSLRSAIRAATTLDEATRQTMIIAAAETALRYRPETLTAVLEDWLETLSCGSTPRIRKAISANEK